MAALSLQHGGRSGKPVRNMDNPQLFLGSTPHLKSKLAAICWPEQYLFTRYWLDRLGVSTAIKQSERTNRYCSPECPPVQLINQFLPKSPSTPLPYTPLSSPTPP